MGESDVGGMEELLEGVARGGELVSDGVVGEVNLGQAKGSELVQAFLDGEIEVPPTLGELLNEEIGEHDDEGMALGPGLESNVEGSHFEVSGFTFPEGPFDEGEVLIALVHQFLGGGRGRQVGLQDVAAIQSGALR